jgi:hypothetical protein
VTSASVIANARSADPAEALAERLSDPRVAASLTILLDHADLLAVLVTGLDALVSRGDTIADSLADGVAELRTAGEQTQADRAQLAGAARQLKALTPAVLDKLPLMESLLNGLPVLESLVSSDLADPRLIGISGTVARAVVRGAEDAATAPVPATGIRALLRALKDPNIARALGFVLSIAKALGKDLEDTRTAPPARRLTS